jgi:ABC-type polysaccharide/polyol phosphate export permease
MLARPPLGTTRDTMQSAKVLFSDAVADIEGALRQFHNCFFLALAEVRLRYRRTLLGPLWISLTTALFIFFISYLHSGFIVTNFRDYLLRLALGWIMWNFIYDSVIQGAQTFQRAADLISNTMTAKFVFVLKTVLANLIMFAHSLLIAIPVYVVAGLPFSYATWLVIPALILIILSAVWSAVIFGILAARYRDFYPSLRVIMRGLFFVTPILWSPNLLPAHSPRRLIVDLNPLAHYIAIWRQPMLGEYPDRLSWLVTGGCTLVGLVLAFVAFARYRRSIVFWV